MRPPGVAHLRCYTRLAAAAAAAAARGGTGAYRNTGGQLIIETIDDSTSKDTLELTGVRR